MTKFSKSVQETRAQAKKSYTEGEFALLDQVKRLVLFFNISTTIGFAILFTLSIVPLSSLLTNIPISIESSNGIKEIIAWVAAIYGSSLLAFVKKFPARNEFRISPFHIHATLLNWMNTTLLMLVPWQILSKYVFVGNWKGFHETHFVWYGVVCIASSVVYHLARMPVKQNTETDHLSIVSQPKLLHRIISNVKLKLDKYNSLRNTRKKIIDDNN